MKKIRYFWLSNGFFLYLCNIQFGEVGEPSGPTSLFYWKSKVFISSPFALLTTQMIWWSWISLEVLSAIYVVNCFQICIFVLSNTTKSCTKRVSFLLWIAFKFVSLYLVTQPNRRRAWGHSCCELLSNLYLCT